MLAKAATSKGFLIDGYPREMEQGTRFEAEVCKITGTYCSLVSDLIYDLYIVKTDFHNRSFMK
jgi:adenylate kinase family enzyme